jgi:hypothetical protein
MSRRRQPPIQITVRALNEMDPDIARETWEMLLAQARAAKADERANEPATAAPKAA